MRHSRTYRSILVPLDGSLLSEQALAVASDLARRSGTLLRLVHVHVIHSAAPIFVEGRPVIDEQMQPLGEAHALAYLEGIRDRLASESDLRVAVTVLDPLDADVRDQTIPEMLARCAATTDTDLIVMTTHGRGGFARFWLGSVADALARSSAVPILLVRSDQATEQGHAPDVRKILVALDGSTLAEQILEPARMLGDLSGASYTLLHVVEPHLLFRSAPFTTPTDFDADDTQRRQVEAKRDLERVAGRLRAAGATVSVDVRVAEPVAPAILDAARDQNVDLVAIATLGRSGLARFLLGSVADKVVRGAPVPVLLYRPQAPRLEDT